MPGLIFGSMYWKAHQAHIALSKPMTNRIRVSACYRLHLPSTLIIIEFQVIDLGVKSCWCKAETCTTWQPGLARRRGRICYIFQQHGVCVLTTSRSGRRGTQLIIAAESAQATRAITEVFFSHSNISSQKVLQSNSYSKR